MAFFRNGRRLQARATDGTFRKVNADDAGIGVCPECRAITFTPPEPADFKAGTVDPVRFRAWRAARVCSCGWQNAAARELLPPA